MSRGGGNVAFEQRCKDCGKVWVPDEGVDLEDNVCPFCSSPDYELTGPARIEAEGTGPLTDDEKARIESPRRIDIGPYCTTCRDDTTGQEKRIESLKEGAEVIRDADGNAVGAEAIVLAGWLCENCQPFVAPMIEAMAQALIERRWKEVEVRRAMRALGEEDMWQRWFGPLLDTAEVMFGLEYR